MVSLDLEATYFQVLIHWACRKDLQFVYQGTMCQFKVLCFGLLMAPPGFHQSLYCSLIIGSQPGNLPSLLNDWLILASSKDKLFNNLDKLLSLGQKLCSCELGEVQAGSPATDHLPGHVRLTHSLRECFQLTLGSTGSNSGVLSLKGFFSILLRPLMSGRTVGQVYCTKWHNSL